MLSGAGESIVVRIFGPELDVLRRHAVDVKQALTGIEGLVDLHEELQKEVPQIQVTVDLVKAGRFGLKPGDVRRAAAAIFAGEEVTDIHRNGKVNDVMVWSTPESRNSLNSVRELLLDTAGGGHVRLSDVADVRIAPSPNVIRRENASRRIDVQANVRGRDLGSVVRDVEDRLQTIHFQLGYHAHLLGEAAERKAALAYEREEERREREQARQEATRQKERERRQQAIDKTQAALDKAKGEHEKRAAAIQAEIEALEEKARAENADWDKERKRLESMLRRVRD